MDVGDYGQVAIDRDFRGLVPARKNNRRKIEIGDRHIPSCYYYYVQEVEEDGSFWISAGMTNSGKRVKKAALSYRIPAQHFIEIPQHTVNRFLERAAAFVTLGNELQFGRRD
jgi:hypothetical protein